MVMKCDRQKDPRSTVGRCAPPARGYNFWSTLPCRLPVQEVARHAPVNVHEADGGRGRQVTHTVTVHGRALEGRPGFRDVYTSRDGDRFPRRHPPAPVVVHVCRVMESDARSIQGVLFHRHRTLHGTAAVQTPTAVMLHGRRA